MKIQKTVITLFLTAFVGLFGVLEVWAIRPLYAPYALVAGTKETAGFKDGSFNTARFNRPLGLTVSDDGTRLFVADSLNNRIRVIHLDQNNEVGTIAGQAQNGASDGPLTLAQFNEPRGVLYLPGDCLAVNDFGNQCLRFVDMKAGVVTTYRGNPVQLNGSDVPNSNATPAPVIKSRVLLTGIKDMAYLSKARSILFTQPEAGVLNVLNLGTGQITSILKDNVLLPHPSALWVQEDKIYVADRDLLSVYSMNWKNNAVTNIQPAGTPVDKLLSLTFSDNTLYGLLKKDGFLVERFILDKRYVNDNESNGLAQFNNGWGDFVPPDKLGFESSNLNSLCLGFVPDPSCKRRFFYSMPSVNIIVSLRDLYWNPSFNSQGLLIGEYPTEKPKNTYRILLLGNCGVTDTDEYWLPTETHPTASGKVSVMPHTYSLAPQVERELNFRAAMDGNPMNYEFLNAGHHGDLMFWPNTEVPDKVKNLDVDMVIILNPALDGNAFYYYYMYNLTPDGVPQAPPDPEYVLKPPLERIPDGLPRKFYDFCKANNWVRVNGRNLEWDFHGHGGDPKLNEMELEFWEKPWEVLNRKLSNIKTSNGNPVKLLILTSCPNMQSPENCRPDFFKDLAQKCNIPFFDLNPYINALDLSYFPMAGPGHLDPNGAIFYGKLLARVLPDENLIPWPIPEKTSKK